MSGLPVLLAALGFVAVLFALLSFLLAVFGIGANAGWIVTNLVVGVLMLGTAAALNFDALRDRMSTGEARRVGKYGTSATLATILAITILGMLGFLATRYHARWDWSEQGVHTLSDQSMKVLQGLEEDVEVVALFAPLDAPPVRDLLERYAYTSDRFTILEFADPNTRPDLLARYEITPEQLAGGLVRIALGDEVTLVTEVGEENITNAMVKLTRTGEKTVYFIEGHNERAIDGAAASEKEGYSRAVEALRNENYRVEKILLAAAGDVPDDADVVVVAGPTRPLLQQERDALDRYLGRGGAVLALVDPRANTDLVEDLETWGVAMGDDVVVDRQLAIFGRATSPFAGSYSTSHEITRDMRDTALFHVVRSVGAKPEAATSLTEIVFTGETSWAERNLERFFGEGEAELDEEDLAGPVPIAVAGSVDRPAAETGDGAAAPGAAQGKLVVFGDADFANNEMIDAYRNRDLFVNSVNWLIGDVEAISVRPNRSRASRFQPTAAEFNRIRLLSLFVLPEVLAVLGGLHLVVEAPLAGNQEAVNPKVTGLLFAAAAALAAFVYFYEIRGEEGRLAADEAEKRLFPGLAAEDIAAIGLNANDGTPVRAERSDAGWALTQPLVFPGDSFAWDAMAQALAEISSDIAIEDAQAPSIYGLDEGRREIHFEAGAAEHSLHLGDLAPVGSNIYVSPGGASEIHLVSNARVNAFTKPLDDLREKRLLDFDSAAVDRVVVGWPGESVVLEKREDGWRMLQPLDHRADEQTVDTLLSDLSFLRASGFEDGPPADDVTGLDVPAFTVALSGGDDGEPFEVALAIGGYRDGDARYARTVHPSLYRVASERVAELPTTVAAYRFKQLADFVAADAVQVNLLFRTEADESVGITAERGEGGWVSEPEAFVSGALAALVEALSNLEARDVAAESMGPDELAELGLAPANTVIRVFGAATDGDGGADAPVLAEIHVGLLRGTSGILARSAGDDTVYVLDYEVAEHLPVSYEAFVNHFRGEPEAAEPAPGSAPEAPPDAG